jgi:hypothetical protein
VTLVCKRRVAEFHRHGRQAWPGATQILRYDGFYSSGSGLIRKWAKDQDTRAQRRHRADQAPRSSSQTLAESKSAAARVLVTPLADIRRPSMRQPVGPPQPFVVAHCSNSPARIDQASSRFIPPPE